MVSALDDIHSEFSDMSNDEQVDVIQSSFFGEEEHEAASASDGSVLAEGSDGSDSAEGGAEHEGEGEAPQQAQAAQGEAVASEPQKAADTYTAEEFLLSDPYSVNRERLPDAARIVHDRYMEVYRTQIEPKLQELEKLKKAQRVASGEEEAEAEEPQQNPADEQFSVAVRAEAARRLGIEESELDDFNSKHVIMMSRVAAALEQRQVSAQQGYANTMRDLRAKYQDFDAIDRWALSEMNSLPYDVHEQVVRGLQSGNPAVIANIFSAFADRYHAVHGSQSRGRGRREPPSVLSGSNGDDRARRSWGVKEFSRGSAKEKASMLIDGGFLDD